MHNKLKIFCKKQTSVIFQPLIKKLRAKDARSLNGYLIISPKTGRSVIDNALRSANELAVLIYYARADVGAEGEQEQGDEVVKRHNHTRPGLRHTELIGQNLRHEGVVGLPEHRD